uniref:FLZ-type domain-containing protein n=1 Tax=Oryza punctata TaxID=4537 RepID=A0A0E0LNB1_ORYPU
MASAVVAKPPSAVPASRRCFFFAERAAATAVGVHAAIAVDDHPVPAPAAAAAAMDIGGGRVAQPARPSARSIMEKTHKQNSGSGGSYCTVPRCSICTGNPFAIADGEKAFCKEECRSRYLEEALREAREEKRRAASPEKKKKEAAAAAAARKGGEECKEGSIFFICSDDL